MRSLMPGEHTCAGNRGILFLVRFLQDKLTGCKEVASKAIRELMVVTIKLVKMNK